MRHNTGKIGNGRENDGKQYGKITSWCGVRSFSCYRLFATFPLATSLHRWTAYSNIDTELSNLSHHIPLIIAENGPEKGLSLTMLATKGGKK